MIKYPFCLLRAPAQFQWIYDHRELIGGLRFVHKPKTLRFFTGKLEPVSDWPEKLVAAYKADFGEDQYFYKYKDENPEDSLGKSDSSGLFYLLSLSRIFL